MNNLHTTIGTFRFVLRYNFFLINACYHIHKMRKIFNFRAILKCYCGSSNLYPSLMISCCALVGNITHEINKSLFN